VTLSINTNTSAMAALQSLSQTTAALNSTENEVSTGKKVSSASDNPAVYAIAQTMNANISGLSAVSDGLSLGAQVVNTASTAADNISSVLQTLQNTVTEAGTDGIDTATMEQQIADSINQINAFARNSTFNGVNVLTTTADSGASKSQANIVMSLDGSQMTIANQATAVSTGATTLSDALGLTSNLGAGNDATASTQSVLGASSTGVNLATSSSLSSGDFSDGNAIVLTNSDGSTTTFEFDSSGTAQTNANSNATDPSTSNAGKNTTVVVTVDKTNESTSQMLGDLVTAMNNNGYTASMQDDGSIDIVGGGVTQATETLNAANGSTGGGFAASTTLSSSKAAIDTIQAAITKMNTISTNLGATTQEITGMQSFTSDLSDALTTGVGGLTDADLSSASAQLTSLQTKQQLAIQSLSIANSQSQSILKLFQG